MGSRMTVAELLQQWLTDYAEERVGGRTLQRYEGIVRNHLVPAFGDLALEDLRPTAIQAYYRRAPCGGIFSTATPPTHRVSRPTGSASWMRTIRKNRPAPCRGAR